MLSRIARYAPLMDAAVRQSFVWQEHSQKIMIYIMLSLVPMFEGRYAVAGMVLQGVPPLLAYPIAFVVSFLPVPFILLLLRPVLDWFYTLPIKPVRAFAAWLERRAARKRAGMHDQKNGAHGLSPEWAELLGLYLFVALPLPGTGVWMGSAIASLFNMSKPKAAVAILLGNATACLITTVAAVMGITWLVPKVR